MKKISMLESPALAGVVRERSVAAAIAEIKNCFCDGADMIDLHLSCLEDTSDEAIKRIVSSSKIPVLALNYNNYYDWSERGYTEEERVALLLRAVDCGAHGIDMQGYTFHAKSKHEFCGNNIYSFTNGAPKEVVTDSAIISKQCELIEKVHAKGAEVLLSCHPGIYMNAEQVVELALFLEKRNPDVVKIVTAAAQSEEQLVESFRAMSLLKKEVKTKVSYHANGTAGALSRIINPMLGSHMIFCVDRYSESSLAEQLDLKAARAVIDNIRKIR